MDEVRADPVVVWLLAAAIGLVIAVIALLAFWRVDPAIPEPGLADFERCEAQVEPC